MNPLDHVKAALQAAIDPEKALFLPRFFKTGAGEYAEGDAFLGVVVPKQRAIAKKYYQQISLKYTERLLHSRWHEERLTALFILVLKYPKVLPVTRSQIFDLYMDNTTHINNWDLVDSSAEFIVGAWLQDNPYKMKVLMKLARSESLWERRIAMLATFHYIKQGCADEALQVIEPLLHDTHDLIQKAVGWMLREIGKRVDRCLLVTFLDARAATMPRTTLRYAIEHFDVASRRHYLDLKHH